MRLANFFLCGNKHSSSDYQALYHGLVRRGHDVFRGYNYENSRAGPQWSFSPEERERFSRIETVSTFRFDEYVDEWGNVVGGSARLLLIERMDAFVVVQTSEYLQGSLEHWTPVGSNTLLEVLGGTHLHRANGRPLLAYFGAARPSYPVFSDFVSNALFLPQDHELALDCLDTMVGGE